MLNDINEQFTDLAREISKAARRWAQVDEEVRWDLVQIAQPFRDATDEVRAG
jgi:DNA-binding IclR family transcriptional regulator